MLEHINTIIVRAVNDALVTRELTVGQGPEYGIEFAGGEWAPSSKEVSPIGAAILYVQPRNDDQSVAAQMALNCVGPIFIDGLTAGLAKNPSSAPGRDRDKEDQVRWLQGFERGLLLRQVLLMVRCTVHETTYIRGRGCPACGTREGSS